MFGKKGSLLSRSTSATKAPARKAPAKSADAPGKPSVQEVVARPPGPKPGPPVDRSKLKPRPVPVPPSGSGKAGSRESDIADMQALSQGLMTEDRAELIKNAMQIRRAKQTVLDALSDEQKEQLVALALKALLNEDPQQKKK